MMMVCLTLPAVCSSVAADEGDEGNDGNGVAAGAIEMKATEFGVRFTPRMASAISKEMVKQMKDRYELDDEQVEDIRGIVGRQFMKVATENAETGRNMIEMMLETVIENGGDFPKEAAQEIGKTAVKLMPALRGFFTESAAEIGKELTIKQRLKFTGDMAAATAGLAVFEKRMKRWEEGKVGDNANPFWDPADDDPSKAEPEPEDPNEHPDHRRARKNVERWIQWQIDIDKQWDAYVDRFIEYYDLMEPQQTAARGVLQDCKGRVERIKTPQLRAALIENRIARRLSWKLGAEVNQGPWMFKLEADYEKMRKPLLDLQKELKRRLEDIPNSGQRAMAREEVRKKLAEKGMTKLPA